MKDKELMILKLLAFGFAGLYVYRTVIKNGGTLAGTPLANRLRSDKLVDNVLPLLNLNHEARSQARELGIQMVDRFVKGEK